MLHCVDQTQMNTLDDGKLNLLRILSDMNKLQSIFVRQVSRCNRCGSAGFANASHARVCHFMTMTA